MRKIIFVIFGLIYTIPAMAVQPSGIIVDAQTNEPVIGATLAYQNSNTGFAYTDENGKITITPDMSPNTMVEISSMGYETRVVPASKISGTIELSPSTEALEAAIVRPCTDEEALKVNATSGTFRPKENGKGGDCIPTKCIEPRYELIFGGTDIAKCEDQVGMPCYDYDENALAGEWAIIDKKFTCKSTECVFAGYTIQNGKCVSIENTDCTDSAKKSDKNVTSAKIELNLVYEPICTIKNCKNGWKPNDDGTKCIEMLSECTSEQKSQHPYASETGIKKGTETCIALDCMCGYDLDKNSGKCTPWPSDKKCTKLPKNAKSGKPDCRDGIEICKIIECDGIEFNLDEKNNQCKNTTGDECTSSDKNAKKAKLEKRDKEMVCVIKTCNKGYTPSDDGLKCEQSAGDCSSQVSQIDPNATKGEYKKKECRITECKNGYDVDNNKCVPISGNCKKLPENALRGTIKFDDKTQSEICLISHCKAGFKPSDDKKSCIVDQEEQNKMDELRDNYEKTKANEQSLANRILGATSMATMGLGAMQAASAKAEQNVYEDVEQDMASYLATFRCDFGTGKIFQGGEKNIQIPGTAELIPLYSEYVNLANDLKARKQQLGMRAGIESEKILDSATTGLYDDVSSGITSGVYASLSRALMNPDGEDAKKWAEMKGETDKKLKQGLTAVGIGAVVGVAGNAIINHGFKEKSQEILNKYKKVGKVFDEIKKSEPVPECSDVDGATGPYPECTCLDKNKVYQGKELGCAPCENGKIPKENKCVCPSGMVEIGSECQKKEDAPATPDNQKCELTGLRMATECKCIDNAAPDSNVCKCKNGYENTDGVCTPEQPKCNLTGLVDTTTCKCIDNATQDGNKCVENNTPKPMFSTWFSPDALFKSGESILTDKGERFLQDFQQKLDSALADAQSENPDITFSLADVENYCIKIIGHADRSKFSDDPTDSKNQKLSEDRANTTKQILIIGKNIPDSNITTSGMGSSQCTVDLYPDPNDQRCRRVDVEFWAGSCQNLKN